MINLDIGYQPNDNLPISIIKKSINENINIDNLSEFKINLSKFLQKKYDQNVFPNDLFITGGIMHSLSLICNIFFEKGSIVYMEDPTYSITIKLFTDLKFKIKYIPMENNGINIQLLDQELEKNNECKNKVLLYIIPCFHNPTGILLCNEKRIKLAKLCDKYDNLLVLADEIHQFLYFDVSFKQMPLTYYHNNIISLGSFSNILGKSLKLGWIHANESILNLIINSGYAKCNEINPLIVSIVNNVVNNDFDKYINNIRINLKNKSILMYNKLIELFKNDIIVEKPNGGVYLWVNFKNNMHNMLKYNNIFRINYMAYNASTHYINYARLSYSYYSNELLEIGIRRLYNLINYHLKIINIGLCQGHRENMMKVSLNGENSDLGKMIIDTLLYNNTRYKNILYLGDSVIDNVDVIIDVSSNINKILQLVDQKQLIKIPLIIYLDDIKIIERIKKAYKNDIPIFIVSNLLNEYSFINDEIKIDIKNLNEIEIINKYDTLLIKHTVKDDILYAYSILDKVEWICKMKPRIYDRIENNIYFTKYLCGDNDYIVIETDKLLYIDILQFVKKYSNRKYGIGCDGLLIINILNEKSCTSVYYNSNGLPNIYSNGLFCIIKHLYENKKINNINIIINNQLIHTSILNNISTIVIDKNKYINNNHTITDELRYQIITLIGQSMNDINNIHCIQFIDSYIIIGIENKEILDKLDIIYYGKQINKFLLTLCNIIFTVLGNYNYIRIYNIANNIELYSDVFSCAVLYIAQDLLYNKEYILSSGDIVNISLDKDNFIYISTSVQKVYSGKFDLNN